MALNPTKFFIKDLINKPTPIDVWVQGTIEQTVGNDILIVSDTSGRAKIVKCETAAGVIDKNSLKKGNIQDFNQLSMSHKLNKLKTCIFLWLFD